MAENKQDVIIDYKVNNTNSIKNTNDLANANNKLMGVFSKLNALRAALTVGIAAGLTKALYECAKAFGESETASEGLKSALRSTNQEVDNNSRRMNEFANEIQRTTIIEDDAIVAIMKTGVAMGMTADQTMQAAKQAVGLAQVTGSDLNSAMKMATAAQAGNYDLMKRAIPTLREIKDETVLAAKANEIMANGFTQAMDRTKTFEGAMIQMSNAVNSAQEAIGQKIAPVIIWFANAVKWLAEGVVDLGKNLKAITMIGDALKIMFIELEQKAINGFKNMLKASEGFLNILDKIPGIDIDVDAAIANLDRLSARLEEEQVMIAERNAKELEDVTYQESEKSRIVAEQKALDAEMQAIEDEAKKVKDAEELEALKTKLMAMSDAELQQAGYTANQISAIRTLQVETDKKKNEALMKASRDYVNYIGQAAETEKDIAKAVAKGTLEWAKAGLREMVMAESAKLVAVGWAKVSASLGTDASGWASIASGATLAGVGTAAINQIQLAEGGSMVVDSPTRIGNNVLAGEAGAEKITVEPLDQSSQNITVVVQIDGEEISRRVLKIGQGERSEGTLDDGL